MISARRIFAVTLSLAFAQAVLPGCASNVADSEDSADSTEYALTKGNWSGFTNGQCVHGVYSFYLHRYGISLPGTCAAPTTGICETCGACEIWKGKAANPPSKLFNKYDWGTTVPQTYDIVVYPPRGGVKGPGHVAAVDHMSEGAGKSEWQKLYVMDSNWYGNEKVAPAPHTVNRAPYGIFRLKSLDNLAPKGKLEALDCTTIKGYAQDPSAKTTSIGVDLFFNGSATNKKAVSERVTAEVTRSDLTKSLGSSDHGFTASFPRSLLDGAKHPIYAYGVDTKSKADSVLTDAPKSITCKAPAIPADIGKRTISAAALKGWKFSAFYDKAPYDAAALAAVSDGAPLESEPSLEQVTGEKEVYVVDGAEHRHVVDLPSFDAWRFDKKNVVAITAAELAATTAGPDWPSRPLLVGETGATSLYLLDGDLPDESGTVSDGDEDTADADAGITDEDSDSPDPEIGGDENADTASSGSSSGCSVGRSRSDAGALAWLLVPALGLFVVRRRSKKD